MTKPSGPLAGVRVVSCESVISMPFSTQLLADLGADVIGVEFTNWRDDSATTAWRIRTGRHKRKIAVDLRDPRGQALVRQLAATADVFCANYRPGVMAKYGLHWEDIHAASPRTVYVAISGFGHPDLLPSPYESVAAFGPIAEAMGGVRAATGGQDGGAEFLALGDIISALYATIGLLAAVRHQERTGEGQFVDVAMVDSLLTLSERGILMHELAQASAARDNTPLSGYYLFDELEASDGLVTVMLDNPRLWVRVAEHFGHPEWCTDPEIVDPRTRRRAVLARVRPVIADATRQQTKLEVASLFHTLDVPAAAVLGPADILHDAHFAARRMLVGTSGADGAVRTIVGNPIKLSSETGADGDRPTVRIASPGEHTVDILHDELGLDDQTIKALLADGVVQESEPNPTPTS